MRIVRRVGIEVGHDDDRSGKTKQQDIAIGRSLRHELGADQPRGTDTIFHHDLLAEHFGQALRYRATDHIHRPTGTRR